MTTIDLDAALARLIRTAQEARFDTPPALEVNGRHHVRKAGGSYEEVSRLRIDDAPRLPSPTCLSVASLAAWAHDTGADGVVHLSRTGTTTAHSPRRAEPWQGRDLATRPFYAELLPPRGPMGYLAFASWVEQLGEGLENHADIRAALASVQAFVGEEAKVRMTGAVVQLKGSQKADVSAPLPRRIVATIPFGDPAFETEVHFALTAAAERGGVVFTVEHLARDGAYDRWAEWAHGQLDDQLPDGWTTLVCP